MKAKKRSATWALAPDTDARTVELKKKLSRRLEDEGYASIRDFGAKSKVPFSVETLRRAFNECDHKALEVSTLAVVLKYLNYTANEIKHILTEYTDDTDLVALIGDTNVEYTIQEQGLVEAYRAITREDSSASEVVAGLMELVGKSVRVNVAKHTIPLRRN